MVLDDLVDHPALAACEDSLSRDYRSLKTLLLNMMNGKAPPPALVANTSVFFKDVLTKLTLLCRVKIPGKLTFDLQPVYVVGLGAVKQLWRNLPKPPTSLNQLEELRRFEWLLTATDREQLATWVKT